jgi:hypothetical protein
MSEEVAKRLYAISVLVNRGQIEGLTVEAVTALEAADIAADHEAQTSNEKWAATPPASDAAVPAGVGVACRFLGAEYSHADLAIAQRAACAIVPYYGTGDHGEQEAARDGKLWNDHPAVQGALRGLYEARAMSVAQIASEDQAYDPAQIAFDQQCDDPAPGDWNDACIHISKELRELRPAAPKVASEAAMREADFYAGYLAACDVTEYDVDKAWSEYVAALHPSPSGASDEPARNPCRLEATTPGGDLLEQAASIVDDEIARLEQSAGPLLGWSVTQAKLRMARRLSAAIRAISPALDGESRA